MPTAVVVVRIRIRIRIRSLAHFFWFSIACLLGAILFVVCFIFKCVSVRALFTEVLLVHLITGTQPRTPLRKHLGNLSLSAQSPLFVKSAEGGKGQTHTQDVVLLLSLRFFYVSVRVCATILFSLLIILAALTSSLSLSLSLGAATHCTYGDGFQSFFSWS